MNSSITYPITYPPSLIHELYGHSSLPKLKKLVPNFYTLDCESYQLRNHIQITFPRIVESYEETVFSFIHWDLSRASSTLGFLYSISFITTIEVYITITEILKLPNL